MRNIRLKPLYLPNDDILVQPPSFLSQPEAFVKDNTSKIYLSNLEDLKTILRGRRLKSLIASKRAIEDDGQECVLKLSEFKVPKITHRSLTRKHTIRKSNSNIDPDGLRNQPPSPIKIDETRALTIAMRTIVSREISKSKELETDVQRITETNKEFESSLNSRMKFLIKETEETSEKITKAKVNLSEFQGLRVKEAKEYDEKMNELMAKETNNALSMHTFKGKRKHQIDVSEEREYFLVKESLRKAKRDLHAANIEAVEKSSLKLDLLSAGLDKLQSHKRNCQKELKDLLEVLINFYCRNLKEGMDLREDGIRWTIKALWNMKQPVPISAFPKYLDDESSHYLLLMAEKDLEINFLQQRLAQFREEIKKDRDSSRFSKSPVELYGIVKERIREIKQKSRAVSLNSTTLVDELDSNRFDTSFARYDEIKEIKTKLRSEDGEISKITLEEVKRVVTNYSPDTHPDIGLAHIIKTLVGDKYRDFRKFAKPTKTMKNT